MVKKGFVFRELQGRLTRELDFVSRDGSEGTFQAEGIADVKHTGEKISARQVRPWNGWSVKGERDYLNQ